MPDQATGLFSGMLRRARLQAARQWIVPPVLDIGCGNGPLSALFPPGSYTGTDTAADTLNGAKTLHPGHRFVLSGDIPPEEKFQTVVLLAVLEHLPDPVKTLHDAGQRLLSGGRIVLTTPHPAFTSCYNMGAALGLFSRAAAEEHHALLDRKTLAALANQAGLAMVHYRRFLGGANQLCILEVAG